MEDNMKMGQNTYKSRLESITDALRAELTGGHPDFIDLTIDELKLHNAKNADYSRGGNPLGNFYRVSDMLNSFGLKITPAQVAFIYMLKQIDAVGRMIFNDYEGSVEGKAERLRDISIYAKLTQILDKENNPPPIYPPADYFSTMGQL